MSDKPRISLRARAESVQASSAKHQATHQVKDPFEHFLSEQLLSHQAHAIGQPMHPAIKVDTQHYRPKKKQISIRLDCDVLEWFQSIPGKYQQHINRVCRAYMLANLQHQTKQPECAVEA